MLSQKTIDIVKATVPALKERGVEITQVFYKNMLKITVRRVRYSTNALYEKQENKYMEEPALK